MIIVIVNNKKLKSPAGWFELTTGQYQRLVTEWILPEPEEMVKKDYFQLFNILTNQNYKEYAATADNEVTIWNAIRFVYERPFEPDPINKYLQVGKQTLEIPKELGSLSIGQNIHIREAIDSCKDLREKISIATAIYLQPLYDKTKFDFKRAKELEKIVLEMPIYKTYSIGFFLLKRANESGNGPMSNLLQAVSNRIMNAIGASQRWLRLNAYALSLILI